MTDLVVLFLVVLWVAVLTPRLVRQFREGSTHSSIDSFHEQLQLLERAGPKLVEPAYRLEVPKSDRAVPGLVLVGADGAAHATPHLVRGVRQKQSAWERRRSRRRRRDLLIGLIALTVITGGLGAMHALHLLWAITGVSALAVAGYVALVAYAQLLHADQGAARPVSPRFAEVATSAGRAGRHASTARSQAVAIVTAGSYRAARAGYPGAWDDDELVSSMPPRHAASGV